MHKLEWAAIKARVALKVEAALGKAVVAFAKEDFLYYPRAAMARSIINHAEMLSQELGGIFAECAAQVAAQCPAEAKVFTAEVPRILADELGLFMSGSGSGGEGTPDKLLEDILGEELREELQGKVDRALKALVAGQISAAQLALDQAMENPDKPIGKRAAAERSRQKELHPKDDPKMIGLADAWRAYGIPKSTLTKSAKKKPSRPGYLRSKTRGRNRYFWRDDLEKLDQSRQSFLDRAPDL